MEGAVQQHVVPHSDRAVKMREARERRRAGNLRDLLKAKPRTRPLQSEVSVFEYNVKLSESNRHTCVLHDQTTYLLVAHDGEIVAPLESLCCSGWFRRLQGNSRKSFFDL